MEIDMKQPIYLATLLTASLFLAACDGDNGMDGMNGSNGTDGLNSLVATRDIAKGDAVCLGGGLALDSGLDLNRNDVLESSEVTATELLECAATPLIRALHASPDAPAVNIWVNGAAALTDVDYAQGSGFLPVVEENVVQVEAITPAGNAVVIDADVSLDYSTEASVIAVNTVEDGIRALAIVNNSDERIAEGYFRAQVVHASPSAPPVDVYVTALGADLLASAPVNGAMTQLDFESYTGRLEVPAGSYQIRIVVAGDATKTAVFDSGEVDLPAGADLMIVAVDNVGPGNAPVELIVLDGTSATPLLDVNTPASVVAVHLSPDAPAVDVLADVNTTAADEALALVRNVSFGEFCDLDSVPAPGDYTISIAANADNNVVPLQFPLVVNPGDEATAIVSGFLSTGSPAITALPLAGDTRSVYTETKLRITHASPSTAEVDLYLVAAGTDISDPMVTPSFAAVPFGASTPMLSIANGMYDAIVTPQGSKTAAIELLGLNFAGGAVLDVIARDPSTDGSEGVLPLPLVIDYSAVPACPAP
jgi:trimeric autotransporter adhesin